MMASEAHNHPGMPQLYYYGSEHRSAYYEVARARLAVAIGDKYLSRSLKVPTRPDPVPVPEVDKPPQLQAVTSGKLKILSVMLKLIKQALPKACGSQRSIPIDRPAVSHRPKA